MRDLACVLILQSTQQGDMTWICCISSWHEQMLAFVLSIKNMRSRLEIRNLGQDICGN